MACPHPANLYTICKSLKAAAAYSTSLLHCFLHSKPRTCATSCQSSTVTICLFFIVSEIQRFFWLESHFSSFTLHPVSFAAIKRDVPLLPMALKLVWKKRESLSEGCSPVTCGIKVNLKKTGVCGLPDGENLWSYEHLSSHGTGLWRTDYGQIDRRTAPPIRKSRLSIAERDRNRNSTFKASVLIYLTKSLSM